MKIKLWISLVLALFAFIFVTQNTATAHVRFLVWSVEMSLVLLVFIMLGSGIIIGWLLSSYLRYTVKRKQLAAENAIMDVEEATVQAASPDEDQQDQREEEKDKQ